MVRSLWTAASGMIAQQANVDTIANNISNVNTTGFKSERAEFKSLLYQTIQTKTTTANEETKPIGARAGLGTRMNAVKSHYTNGAFLDTGLDTDFAINGDGFFQVDEGNGKKGYTRDGSFNWSPEANGTTLCTAEGYHVLDSQGNPIRLPVGVQASAVQYSSDGMFGYQNADGSVTSLNQSLGLWQFNNPTGLEKDSDNLLHETDNSGQAVNEATQANLVKSTVRQKYLEGSNVQVANEMVNLIVAQRAYELNSKAITTSDDMMQQANNLKR